jgi:thymidylate kinase
VTTSRRQRAIALVGIDGSGKTTQAHRIAELLAAAGVPAAYRQNAGGRHWFGRLAHRIGVRDGERLLGDNGMMVVELALRWLAIARARLLTFVHREVSVMDRYAVCQYASIRSHHSGGGWERVARALYRVFPAPDVTFYLAVDPEVAYERIRLRGIDQETLEYLQDADAAYRSLPEFPSFVVVDANGSPDTVTAALLAYLVPPAQADPDAAGSPADVPPAAAPAAVPAVVPDVLPAVVPVLPAVVPDAGPGSPPASAQALP